METQWSDHEEREVFGKANKGLRGEGDEEEKGACEKKGLERKSVTDTKRGGGVSPNRVRI
jgi:hypothetical protein